MSFGSIISGKAYHHASYDEITQKLQHNISLIPSVCLFSNCVLAPPYNGELRRMQTTSILYHDPEVAKVKMPQSDVVGRRLLEWPYLLRAVGGHSKRTLLCFPFF